MVAVYYPTVHNPFRWLVYLRDQSRPSVGVCEYDVNAELDE